jgi:hypothetical protein
MTEARSDRSVLEVRPRHRDVELDAGRRVPQQEHETLAREAFDVVDSRHDSFLGQRLEESGDVDPISSDRRVDIRGHATHASRDHGDAANDHPGNAGRVQGARQS